MTKGEYLAMKNKTDQFSETYEEIEYLDSIISILDLVKNIQFRDKVACVCELNPSRLHEFDRTRRAELMEGLVEEIKKCAEEYCRDKMDDLEIELRKI